GVAAGPVPAVLREQLKLQRGFGLVVEYVDKDSPAAAAGVHVHDILQKVDDQWIINSQQLLVLVRSKKPGDSVALTVISVGQPIVLTAKLTEKELPVLDDPFSWNGDNDVRYYKSADQLDGATQGSWQQRPWLLRTRLITAPDGTLTRIRNDSI